MPKSVCSSDERLFPQKCTIHICDKVYPLPIKMNTSNQSENVDIVIFFNLLSVKKCAGVFM